MDPEVVDLLGITPDELASYKNPAGYQDEGGKVAQPGADAPGPHMNYPKEIYAVMLSRTDEEVLNSVPSDPPVQPQREAS